jgi:predicted transcriptional regulator
MSIVNYQLSIDSVSLRSIINKIDMTKEAIIKVVNDLPNDFDMEELLDKLIFMAKVEKGMQQIEEGKVISHDEMKKKIKSWSK